MDAYGEGAAALAQLAALWYSAFICFLVLWGLQGQRGMLSWWWPLSMALGGKPLMLSDIFLVRMSVC